MALRLVQGPVRWEAESTDRLPVRASEDGQSGGAIPVGSTLRWTDKPEGENLLHWTGTKWQMAPPDTSQQQLLGDILAEVKKTNELLQFGEVIS